MQTNTRNTVLITGNTYPVKEEIKQLGGRWDAINKGWNVPEENAAQAQVLVSSAGKPRVARYRSGSSYTRFSSGAEVFTNRSGRCEDAPCCGCCS